MDNSLYLKKNRKIEVMILFPILFSFLYSCTSLRNVKYFPVETNYQKNGERAWPYMDNIFFC